MEAGEWGQIVKVEAAPGHDWATSRWLKYLTLLVFFNSWPAAFISLALGLLIGLLKVVGRLSDPQGWENVESGWWVLLQHLVAMLVLAFWQHVRSVICGSRLAFLDRLCIPQHDEEIKNRCINGLASFLNHSDNLVVLWSPKYCSRLWCMCLGPVTDTLPCLVFCLSLDGKSC